MEGSEQKIARFAYISPSIKKIVGAALFWNNVWGGERKNCARDLFRPVANERDFHLGPPLIWLLFVPLLIIHLRLCVSLGFCLLRAAVGKVLHFGMCAGKKNTVALSQLFSYKHARARRWATFCASFHSCVCVWMWRVECAAI